MQVIRGLNNIKAQHRGSVLTIGNFDGVHLGHQHVIDDVKKRANAHHAESMVMTFEPHPIAYFQREKSPCRLTTLRGKCEVLARLGVDNLLCLPFNAALAELAAENFVHDILVDKLQVKHIVVGHDFRFGKMRRGNFELLHDMSACLGFSVSEAEVFYQEGERVSSSQLRQLINRGEVKPVHQLLGRPYSIRARVRHGDGRGRLWGFPTANLSLNGKQCVLPYGIYVVESYCPAFGRLQGVASFGVRPTINHGLQPLLEVHILQGEYDLYGMPLEVHFLSRLRDELKFSSTEALVQAIREDCRQALAYFSQQPK